MKYKPKRNSTTKYSSFKTEAQKAKLLKLMKFKRRVTIALCISFFTFVLSRPGGFGAMLRDSISAFSSTESNIFLSAKDYMTGGFSSLKNIGKAGAQFRDEYLRPPTAKTVYAKAKPENEIVAEKKDEAPLKSNDRDTKVISDSSKATSTEDAEVRSDSSKATSTETAEPNTPSQSFLPRSPIPGKITSSFGERVHPVTGEVKIHNGIDIAAKEGDEVKVIFDGVVEKAEYNQYSGNYVIIRHTNDITSSYAHMSALCVKPGDSIKTGEIIGYAGSTGIATGPHLHMEIRINGEPVNPEEYFSQG